MKDLIELVQAAQSGDETAILDIIDMFKPLIGKYTRMMNYDEDFKSEMVWKLISFVKNEFHIDKLKENNNYVILRYIQVTLYNHYILLSKEKQYHNKYEMNYEYDILVDLSDNNQSLQEGLQEGLLLETLKSILTDRELLYINMIIIQGFTAEEIARKFGITKQAVNQYKNRALKKLRSYFN